MIPLPQTKAIKVKVADAHFQSIPDGTLISRALQMYQSPPVLVMIENKAMGTDKGQFQIPGEMLAVAYKNYFKCGKKFDQTIFAMRVIRTLSHISLCIGSY